MSVAAIIKISLTEDNAQRIIEDARIKARRIIEDAKTHARYILSEENIDRLVDKYIKHFREELKSLELETLATSDEEIELLTSISDDELLTIAKEIAEVIINETVGELSK